MAQPGEEQTATVPRHVVRAFDVLAARHRPALYKRARALCRTHLDADDLVQDTLERALRAFHQLREHERARPWLFSILTRAFVDLLRRRRGEATLEIRLHGEAEPAAAPPAVHPSWARVTTEELASAIDALPDDVRDAYRMHALGGAEYVEIAAKLGIPKGTVGTRLLRARRLLKERLLQRFADEGDAP